MEPEKLGKFTGDHVIDRGVLKELLESLVNASPGSTGNAFSASTVKAMQETALREKVFIRQLEEEITSRAKLGFGHYTHAFSDVVDGISIKLMEAVEEYFKALGFSVDVEQFIPTEDVPQFTVLTITWEGL